MNLSWFCLSILAIISHVNAYEFLREYSGRSFFDKWDFYGSWDNLTNGDVWWLDREDSFNQRLAYVNNQGNAIIKVDNTSFVPFNEKRNTVRITTKDFYDFGSLWIIDVVHLPYGCSVWPAFWSKGPTWPDNGEIDIIEAVNLMSSNQYALHTLPGCWHTTPSEQLSKSNPGQNGEFGEDCSTKPGCTVTETRNGSFGEGFAKGGGGVWATQFDVEGVFIWFWPRGMVPASIQQTNSTSGITLLDWGHPSASYPATNCTMDEFFTPQQLILDITLCGDWGGLPQVYDTTCGGNRPTGLCYPDNVVGPGSRFDQAFFEIKYLRTYTTGAAVPSQTITPTSTSTTVTTSTNTASTTSSSSSVRTTTSRTSTPSATLAIPNGVVVDSALGNVRVSGWVWTWVWMVVALLVGV